MKESRESTIEKLHSSKGFTLAEALVAVLILLLVSGVVAAGIPAAGRAYDNVVQVSNAEVLLSTAMSALRNELGMSKDIEIDGNAVKYYNEGFATKSAISRKDNEGIMYQRYAADEIIGNKGGETVRLVSKKTSGNNLKVTYNTVEHDTDKNVIVFKGLVVKKVSNNQNLTKPRDLSIRVLTE